MGRIRTSGINTKLQISIEPNIGLDGDARKAVIETLNTILADESVLSMKTHCAYWHVHGPGFLELRTLFNRQHHRVSGISDEIAARVCMLGSFPVGSFEEFLRYTRLVEQPAEATDMMSLLADHEALVRFLREDARKSLEEYEDHSTYALLVQCIGMHEKMAWVLRSYIDPELPRDERRNQ